MNEIINEMEKMEAFAKESGLPRPVYLYVQAYGKELRSDMMQLAEKLGYAVYTVFDRQACRPDRKCEESFGMFMNSITPPGQEYDGCILIDFTGFAWEDICCLIAYLSVTEKPESYIFTIEETEDADSVYSELNQHFFVRKVEAVQYSVEEQLQIIKSELQKYKKGEQEPDEAVLRRIREHLQKLRWNSRDMVIQRLRNMVARRVYDCIMELQSMDFEVDIAFVDAMFETMKKQETGRFPIGFCAD